MNRISQIRETPTGITDKQINKDLEAKGLPTAYHESLLRSFQTLRYVKELLEKDTPPTVILDILDEIYKKGI